MTTIHYNTLIRKSLEFVVQMANYHNIMDLDPGVEWPLSRHDYKIQLIRALLRKQRNQITKLKEQVCDSYPGQYWRYDNDRYIVG